MKKNVASQVVGAQLISASDGSAFTGAVTVAVTGDGGTQATGSVGSGACTHEGGGFHTYAPAQAETNYDHVAFTFSGSGAIPVTVQIYTGFPQTGDSYARVGAPVGASISADIAAVKTQTAAIETDTQDLQSRTPAALVSGRMDASVGAMASSVVTASAIATGAITNAKFAAGAIDAAAIAADAIGASELAADAATEIGTAVWATTTRLLTAGTNIVLAKGTGVTGFNDLSAAQVNSEVDTALADYDAPTKAEMDAGFAALNNLSSAQAQTAAAAALTAYDPPTRAEATSDKDAILAKLPSALTDGRMAVNVEAVAGIVVQTNGSGTQEIGGP